MSARWYRPRRTARSPLRFRLHPTSPRPSRRLPRFPRNREQQRFLRLWSRMSTRQRSEIRVKGRPKHVRESVSAWFASSGDARSTNARRDVAVCYAGGSVKGAQLMRFRRSISVPSSHSARVLRAVSHPAMGRAVDRARADAAADRHTSTGAPVLPALRKRRCDGRAVRRLQRLTARACADLRRSICAPVYERACFLDR